MNDINKEQRQSISLSKYAEEIIQLDCLNFPSGKSYTGIINAIIQNSLALSSSIIAKTLDSERSVLCDLLQREKYIRNNPNDVSLERYCPPQLTDTEKELLSLLALGKMRDTMDTMKSYPKDITKKIRLQNKTVEAIDELEASGNEYLKTFSNRSDIIKAILEEYAHSCPGERERILYRETVSVIEDAIADGKPVRIDYRSSQNHESEWIIRPYKIITDSESLYNYLIGYAHRVEDETGEPDISSFRISRIADVKLCRGNRSGKIAVHIKKDIEKKLSEVGPQFLIGDYSRFEVLLTEEGYNMFKSQLHLRPAVTRDNIVADGNGNKILHFDCSRKQVESYFFKFGRDAVIQAPKELADDFRKRYRDAAENYTLWSRRK